MPSWFRLLDNAQRPSEVVAIVRDYFARWSPEEIALLPVACRPPHIRDVSDVEELHRCAVEAYRSSRATGEALTLLQKLTGFVACATVRIAQVDTRAPGGGATDCVRPPKKVAAGRQG